MTTPDGLAQALDLRLIKTVADRRGSWLLQVARGDEIMALKGSDPHGADTYDRDLLIAHEGEVLKGLGDLADGLFVDQGHLDAYGNWVLMRWIDGATASTATARIRTLDPEPRAEAMQALFVAIMEKYSAIHASGTLHGDVQPSHIMLPEESNNILILDWGLARRAGHDDPSYKGGFVHYAAPEIARQMLAEDEAIPYDMAAEVYSLGALMFFCLTGETAVDYGPGPLPSIPLRSKLAAVADGRIRSFVRPCTGIEEHLQQVILDCLEPQSTKRPESAAAICDALARP